MKVLVTGATGKIGSLVVPELLKRGVHVRVLVRKQSSFPSQVEVVVGDLLDPVAVRSALSGVNKLFLLNALVPDEIPQALIACNLAKRLGIEQITYLSIIRAEQAPEVPHFAAKLAAEKAIRALSVPFTILRPAPFYQNDAAFKDLLLGPGVYPNPIGVEGTAAVDVRDIAEAAAVTLTEPGHLGKTYELVGPTLLNGPDVAALWSRLLSKAVVYPGADLDAWETQMRSFMPAYLAYDLRLMFDSILEKGLAATKWQMDRVTKLLGHPARSYEAFAQELAQGWTASKSEAS